jgi:FkbM family methyltransferase
MTKSRISGLLGLFGLAGGGFERGLRSLHHRLQPPPDPVGDAIRLFGAAYPDAIFVQIGANDGVVVDPLRLELERRQWRGLMVEPVPYVFSKLAERYGNHPRITLVNAAIADRDGSLPFYSLRETKFGEVVWPWYHTLGSFKKEVVLKHDAFVPDIAERVVEIQVPCLSFATLCSKYDLQRVDMLQIDAEGYDYEIIRTIPFAQYRPRLIVYEHHHLSAQDRADCRQLVRQQGYRSFEFGLDTAALDETRLEPKNAALLRLFSDTVDQPAPPLKPVQ